MIWFHTLALPIATAGAIFIGVKRQVPAWKHGAVVLGAGLMLAGLWIDSVASTPMLFAGCAGFLVGAAPGRPALA